jgi:hypothetical protein
VFTYVVLNVPRPEGAAAKALIEELRTWVGEQLSPIAKPDEIRLTDNLPKTRSGKIMRRLLRSIARGEEITQDMSTLENPAILEQLRGGGAPPPPPAPVAAKRAAPVTRVAPVKGRAPAKKAVASKKAVAAKKGTSSKAAARSKPKKAKAAAKRSRPVSRSKPAKRTKPVKHTKPLKRKVVAAKKRRVAVKAVRRKPRGKK